MAADGGRRGYQHLLDAFWHEAKRNRVALPVEEPVSAAAFCNARKRLAAAAVRHLLRTTAEEFDRQHGQDHRLQGRRVLAVDGCKMSLQRSRELWEEFGAPGDAHAPQILVSVLFDVLAKLPLDAQIGSCTSDERTQLGQLLASTREGDILVLDRGYPSYVMIDLLLEHGLDFVLRVPISRGFPAVEEFLRSGSDDDLIVLRPAASHPAHVLEPRKLRAIRRSGPDGEPQVFLTSLPRSQFSHASICDLYRRRWQVELFYRLEKSEWLGHHQFHAKHAEGVRQEVFAFLLFTAITRTLTAAAARDRGAQYERISQKSALLATSRALTILLLDSEPESARQTLAELLDHIASRRDPKARERACPRRSFKPRSRWGPHGRILAQAGKEQLR